ncbi:MULTISPECIES: ogr/Delta-like zinc finger family protein [Acinetobacter]|uniref:ogr/Delta-like zinc finger family protein n=2 Tax=Acinetobacter TaxID=469 RepID=UPI00280C2288|nr:MULTISPECIES: ogr/Delta-like zinc finger family protein [Acinetobacter]MDR7655026.1 ogr/Delta-like zinc finger family protein [Acinetobacter junii]
MDINITRKATMASKNCFLCPHCASKFYLRTSKLESPLFRVVYFQCSNIKCGFSARAEFAITHQVAPSANPNPLVNLKTYGHEADQRNGALKT